MPRDGRKATSITSQLDHRRRKQRWEGEVLAIASRQHGVVTLEQLRSLGLAASSVRARIASGRLHVIHRSVYAMGRRDLPFRGHWMAAVLACGDGAVLSYRAAAALRGLLTWNGGTIDVTIPRRSTLSRRGIRVHRSTGLLPSDCGSVERIPCTSVTWTLLDLAATVPRGVLERACDQAEKAGSLDMRRVEELLARRHGQPGVARLRAALRIGHPGEGIPKSELERRFLALIKRAGLPTPAVNESMAIAGEEWQCDFVWHAQRVVVEVDGWDTHRTRRAFEEDRRRHRVLRLAGWEPVRFTWYDVTTSQAHVAATVNAILSGPRIGEGRVAHDYRAQVGQRGLGR